MDPVASVDDDYVLAFIGQESGGDPDARSYAGAEGLMQLMPETAARLGVEDSPDPEVRKAENVAGGIRLLEQEMGHFKDPYLTAAAYYTGRGNVETAIRRAGSREWDQVSQHFPYEAKHGPSVKEYAEQIMSRYDALKNKRLADAQEQQDAEPTNETVWGTPAEFALGIEDLATQQGFDELPTQQKIQLLSRLYDGRKWIPEVDPLVKSAADAIWKNAPTSDLPDLASATQPYLASVTGKDDEEILQSGENAKNQITQLLKKDGFHPGLYGSQIDDLFDAKVRDEQERVAARDRGFFGTVGRVGAEFMRGAAEGYTSAAAAAPDLLGFNETGEAIRTAPEKMFGSTRELDYEINPDGSVATDEHGEPITRYRGMVIRGLGQVSSLLAGGALMKGAGYGLRAIQGAIGGVNTLAAMDAGYSETRAGGGSHGDGVKAAVIAAPIAALASLEFTAVLGSGNKWIEGLSRGGQNWNAAVANVMLKAGEAGAANVATEAGIAAGASVGTGENRFTTERLAVAGAAGALPGAVIGGYQARSLPGRTTVVQPEPKIPESSVWSPDVPGPLPLGLPAPPVRLGLPAPENRGLPPPPSGPTIALGPRIDPETQVRLAQEFEKFQQSSAQRTVIDVPRGAEIPPGLLEVFPSYGAFRLSDTQIELIKGERAVPFPEIDTTKIADIDAERQRLVQEISEDPRPGTTRELHQERRNVKEAIKDHYRNFERSLDESKSDDALVELRRQTKKEIEDNRIEYSRTTDRTLREILNLDHDELITRKAQIQESLTTNPQRMQVLELKERLAKIDSHLKKLSGSYVDDLKQREARINELGQQRSALVKEQSKFIEQHPFKEVAIKVDTDYGPRWALAYKDAWHVLDDGGRVMTSGHWNLPDAMKAARDLDSNYTPSIEAMRRSPTSRIKIGEGLKTQLRIKRALTDKLPPKKIRKNVMRFGDEPIGGKKGKKATEPAPPEEGVMLPDDNVLGLATGPDSQERLRETVPRTAVSDKFVGAAPHTKEGGSVRDGTEQIAVTELMDKGRRIVAALKSGVGISEGGRIRPGVRGYFAFNKHYIRLGQMNDPVTLTHEAAHAIDKKVLGKWDQLGQGDYDQLSPEVQQGLRDTSETFYAAPLPTKNLQLAEGFAMFVQHYVTGQKVHRDVVNWFKTEFAKNAPQEFKAIESFRELAYDFYSQTSQNAFRAFRSSTPPSLAKRFSSWLTDGVWKDDWLNTHQPLVDLDRAVGTDVANVADSRRNTATKAADYLINEGLRDFDSNVIPGRALRDHIEPLTADERELFVDYATAKRLKQRYVRNDLEPGHAIEDIDKVIFDTEANHPRIIDAANGWWDSWLSITKGLEISSPIAGKWFSEQRAKNLELTGAEHGYYLPVQREGRAGVKLGAEITGSRRTIENFMGNVHPVLRGMWETAIRQHTIDYLLQKISDPLLPTGGYGVKVTNDLTLKQLDAEFKERVGEVAKHGLKSKLTGEGENFSVDPDTEAQATFAVSFLDPQMSKTKAPQGFVYIAHPEPTGTFNSKGVEKFKMEYYELPERVWGVFENQLPEWTSKPLFNMFFRGPKQVLQAGATVLRPAFIATNAARDLQSLFRRSNTGANPLMLMKYTAEALQQTAAGKVGLNNFSGWYKRIQAMGLQGSSRFASEGYLKKLSERKYKVVDFAEATLDKAMNLMGTLEEGLRTTAFVEKAHELGLTPESRITPEQFVELSLAYKRSTTDFAVQGKHARVVNLAVPFFTARIAEVAQLSRDIRERPGRVAAIGLGWLSYGAMYALAHKDEDWYKEMDPKDRGQWMHVPHEVNGEKRLLRMPLDTLGAAFFTMGQGFASNAYEKGEIKPSGAEFASAILKSTMPVNVSFDSLDEFSSSIAEIGGPLAKEFAQQKANRDFYFNKDIVPRGLEFEPTEEQYTQYTTELSKTIGQITGWSPARIDHAIRSTFPVAIDAAHIVEDLTGVKRPKGREKDSLGERLQARITEAGLRYGLADDNFARSNEKFYDLLDKFQTNQAQETPEERKGRLRLNEVHNRISAIDTVLRQTTGKDREELSEAKRNLLDAAFAIGRGEVDASLDAAPKSEAKRIKKELKEKKTEARAKKGSTVFEDATSD